MPPDHPRPTPVAHAPRWDVFCRVIDNRGDAGVAWRLARNLALLGRHVRLWIDLPQALDGMADDDDRARVTAGWIAVAPWAQAEAAWPADADAVVEAFGCTLPDGVLRAMAARRDHPAGPPAWINLEYLSAEAWVERSHGLPSPRPSGPAEGLVTWFWFPGFTPATGGLLREPWVADAAAADDAAPPDPRHDGGFMVSRFDYGPHAAMDWLADWALRRPGGPLVLRLSAGVPGAAAAVVPSRAGARLVLQREPWHAQRGYDDLLAACDLNIVRGEDSFVRAQWAGRPMLWHIYPQDDGAHAAKLEAWLDRYLDGAPDPLATAVRQAHRAWNGLARDGASPAEALAAATDPAAGWAAHARRWRAVLLRQGDLASRLVAFADAARARGATPSAAG